MPVDRFRARNALDRARSGGRESDKPKWEGGLLRTFLVRHEQNGLRCTVCGRMPNQGDTMATVIGADGKKSYQHYYGSQCDELTGTLTERRRQRNAERIAARHPEQDDDE